MVKDVPHINCDNLMQVMCEDRLPMSLDNMREGCRVLGSCRMELRWGNWLRSVGSIVDTWG